MGRCDRLSAELRLDGTVHVMDSSVELVTQTASVVYGLLWTRFRFHKQNRGCAWLRNPSGWGCEEICGEGDTRYFVPAFCTLWGTSQTEKECAVTVPGQVWVLRKKCHKLMSTDMKGNDQTIVRGWGGIRCVSDLCTLVVLGFLVFI